jgi:hypothetical protein
MHAGERSDYSRATSQQHSSDKNVGEKAEANVDAVSNATISGPNNLEEGMRIGRPSLQLNGNSCEENDLNSGTRSILCDR